MTLPRRLHVSFALRLAALLLGLFALLQLASITAIGLGLDAQARRTLPERLAAGERVFKSLLEQRAQALTDAAAALAADAALRAAALSDDRATLASLLERHGARIGATEAAWLGTDFGLRARTGEAMQQAAIGPAAAALAVSAGSTGSASGLVLVGGRPHQLALVPVKAPGLLGWVALGLPIDDRLGAELHTLTSLDLTLLARDSANDPWRGTHSTLGDAAAREIAAQPWNGAATPMASLEVAGEELGLRPRWLATLGAADRESGPAMLALLSLSIDAAAGMPRELQWLLLGIGLFGAGVFAVAALHTARRITAPLRELADAAERLGTGDATAPPLAAAARSDEIGEAARRFEHMRASVVATQQQTLRLAYRDTLTGLPNRAQFDAAVHEAIAASAGTGSTLAVLVLDLDRFRNINDRLGHAVGDRLLQAAGERLARQVMREGDMVARRAGDQFAVLLRESTPELAHSVAQRIALAFEQPLALDEHRLAVPVGVGIACWPGHADSADTLVHRAERAMLAAKRGRSGPLVYEPAMDDGSAQSLALLDELREALARGELRLHLQPKLSMATGGVAGAEALLRWQHPRRGLLPPGEFIPFAEQTGLVRELTLWVFEACARTWRELQAEGADMVLSLNLSARDLLDAELPARLEKRLLEQRVPAEAFCLEITEGAFLDDPQRALATLKRLSLMGFKLSIDDFGAGLSSYAWLKQLPVDELKIDTAFVRNMDRDPVDAKLVRSMIELAHNLGFGVVAEGVENARTWELLRELSCEQAQGFHMGRPMPVEEFLAWSARWVDKRRLLGTAGSAGLLH